MRKIIFRGSAKTVGTDFAVAVLYSADTHDSVLDQDCWQESINNAEMYGWDYVGSDYEPEVEEGEDEYYVWDHYCTDDDLSYYWEEYEPEKHDIIRAGGGSFEEDFARQAERM